MTDDDGDLALLGDLLDRSFGSGPAGLPTPADRLESGRRALQRRRRLIVAGTSAAVVVTIGAGFALSGAVGERGADGPTPPLATPGPTAASPAATASPADQAEDQASTAEREHRQAQRLVSRRFPASLDTGGNVVVKDGWRITERVENPLGLQPPEASLGVVVTDGVATRWMLLTLEHQQDGDGQPTDQLSPAASADDPGKGYARFEDWLAEMGALNGGPEIQPLLTVDDADRLRPGPGAEMVATRPAPVVDGYTDAGDRMAEVRRDSRTWFVIVRGHGADAEVIPVDAAVLAEPTFAAFVDHVRSQVASGEGLR
jgi:hypothetical protein